MDYFRKMYSVEANRLYQLAVKEELSGKFDANDPLGMIQLDKCPQELGRIRVCVLFRYAAEGVAEYRAGVKSGNLNQASLGYNRFVASQLAINPPDVQTLNFTQTVDGMVKFYKSNYELVQQIPPSKLDRPFGVNLEPSSKGQSKSAKQSAKKNRVQGVAK